MPLIVGLYSPRPQSGKSTACQELATLASIDTLKVSGAMKAMCAAAIAPFVPEADMDGWVEGAYKDKPVPNLLPDCAQNPAVADALIAAMGVDNAQEDDPLPLRDATGTALTRGRIRADLVLAWGQAMAAIFGQNQALTPRDLQKTLGLEFGRKLYGMDFWLRILEARVAASTSPLIVIDDMRFHEDAQFVADRGGITVRIYRPDAQDHDAHPSEGLLEDWPFTVRLDNDSTKAAYSHTIARTLLPVVEDRLRTA